jgi:hypothetical protein
LNQTSWLPFVKDQHIELTSTTKIHMEKDFNVICERTPKPMAGKNYFPPGTITVASSNASTYSIDMNEETVFGPALQSKAAATEKQLRAQLEAAEALAQKRKEQIETARIEIKPFIVPSGGVRPGMPPTGPDVGFYTVRNNAPEVWLGKVKQMLCPKAERVTAELVAQAPADCCGIQQYVLVCSYAETE